MKAKYRVNLQPPKKIKDHANLMERGIREYSTERCRGCCEREQMHGKKAHNSGGVGARHRSLPTANV
jgi:hypothetical protein